MSLDSSFGYKLSNIHYSSSTSDLKDEDKSFEDKDGFVRLARRRASRDIKDKQTPKKTSTNSKSQGRPLSKETRVKLTLVPTLGILYSILVSETLRKPLNVLKYSNEKDSIINTNQELSTKNIISGFSSLLNVQTARFYDDPAVQLNKNSSIPEFSTIDEAVSSLFGVHEYSLIRVTRAAATEVGGSILLKIETAIPGHLYLNDDEDEDFQTVEKNKDYYQDLVGSIGDRPTTTFLKKRVARPRYKSDMRVYLIPKCFPCAIYCESRMFKRDLLRGFLNLNNVDRSVIISFDYEEMLNELVEQGHEGLIKEMGLPTVEQFEALQESVKSSLSQIQPISYTQQSIDYTHASPTSASLSFLQPASSFDVQSNYSHENSRYTYLQNPDRLIPSQYIPNHQIQPSFISNGPIFHGDQTPTNSLAFNQVSYDLINPPQLQQTSFAPEQSRRLDMNFSSQIQPQQLQHQASYQLPSQVFGASNPFSGQVNSKPNSIWTTGSVYNSGSNHNTLYQQI